MPKSQIRIDYQLTFESAFHMGTGLRDGLIHRAAAKDPSGFLYVPGSTIKGVTRDRCARIGALFHLPPDDPHRTDLADAHPDATLMALIFGSQFRGGHVHFDDAALTEEDRKLFTPPPALREWRDRFLAWQTEKRTQVSIWRPTGTAESGFLYNSEYGVAGLRFDGRIAGSLPAGLQGEWGLALLLAGLLSIDRIGGNKSSGGGLVACSIRRLLVGGKEADYAAALGCLPEFARHAAGAASAAGAAGEGGKEGSA